MNITASNKVKSQQKKIGNFSLCFSNNDYILTRVKNRKTIKLGNPIFSNFSQEGNEFFSNFLGGSHCV